MLFDKFFEIGVIIIGFMWVCNQILGSFIHLYDISAGIELKQKELEVPEWAKRMYS